MTTEPRLTARFVLAEKMLPSGGIICSALWQGRRVAERYYGYTRKEAIRLFLESVNSGSRDIR